MNEKLYEVLCARERRVVYQKKLLKKYDLPLLSITLNIPGAEKDNEQIRKIFQICLRAVKNELRKNENTRCLFEQKHFTAAGPEGFFIIKGLSEKELKKIAISVEDVHPLGRLFDIDVVSRNGHKIYRKDVGNPLRKCIICKNTAIDCIASRKHSRKEVIKIVREMINDFVSLKSNLNKA